MPTDTPFDLLARVDQNTADIKTLQGEVATLQEAATAPALAPPVTTIGSVLTDAQRLSLARFDAIYAELFAANPSFSGITVDSTVSTDPPPTQGSNGATLTVNGAPVSGNPPLQA